MLSSLSLFLIFTVFIPQPLLAGVIDTRADELLKEIENKLWYTLNEYFAQEGNHGDNNDGVRISPDPEDKIPGVSNILREDPFKKFGAIIGIPNKEDLPTGMATASMHFFDDETPDAQEGFTLRHQADPDAPNFELWLVSGTHGYWIFQMDKDWQRQLLNLDAARHAGATPERVQASKAFREQFRPLVLKGRVGDFPNRLNVFLERLRERGGRVRHILTVHGRLTSWTLAVLYAIIDEVQPDSEDLMESNFDYSLVKPKAYTSLFAVNTYSLDEEGTRAEILSAWFQGHICLAAIFTPLLPPCGPMGIDEAIFPPESLKKELWETDKRNITTLAPQAILSNEKTKNGEPFTIRYNNSIGDSETNAGPKGSVFWVVTTHGDWQLALSSDYISGNGFNFLHNMHGDIFESKKFKRFFRNRFLGEPAGKYQDLPLQNGAIKLDQALKQMAKLKAKPLEFIYIGAEARAHNIAHGAFIQAAFQRIQSLVQKRLGETLHDISWIPHALSRKQSMCQLLVQSQFNDEGRSFRLEYRNKELIKWRTMEPKEEIRDRKVLRVEIDKIQGFKT